MHCYFQVIFLIVAVYTCTCLAVPMVARSRGSGNTPQDPTGEILNRLAKEIAVVTAQEVAISASRERRADSPCLERHYSQWNNCLQKEVRVAECRTRTTTGCNVIKWGYGKCETNYVSLAGPNNKQCLVASSCKCA